MITPATRQRLDHFSGLVRGLHDRARWLVLMHDNPDPDALAAGATLAKLLHRGFGRRVTLAYGGLIGRAENREMVRVLGLRLSHVRHLKWHHYGHVALVDTQPRTGNNQLPEDRVPDVVFDHHPLRRATQQATFADVRTDYGATATLLAEYFFGAGLECTRKHATALVYAIQSETQDFGREFSGPDRSVFDRLQSLADRRALAKIRNARLPLEYFRDLHQALENLEGVGTLIVSHLGEVEQPDIVPEIADLLLRLEGKTWSLSTGACGGRLYLSVRTTNPRADAGRLMRRLVGRRGKGGGHGMMAGGWIPLGKAPNADVAALQHQLAKRFAVALRKSPSRLAPLRLR